MAEDLALTIANERSEIERLSRFVDAFGETNHLSADLTFAMNLALDEVLTNIIVHGFDDRDEHPISVRLSLDADALAARIEDDGRPFNPLQTPAIVDAGPESGAGGLGIHIVRSTMDTLEYRREGDRNVLMMSKRVGAERRRGPRDE